jgi:hypothetical protein
MWYDEKTKLLRACTYSSQEEVFSASPTCVKKISMGNPKHINTSEDVPIVICYNRHPASVEKVDYDYSEAFDEKTHKQCLYLDVSGDVELDSKYGSFQYVDMTDFVLKLYCDSGVAEYNLSNRMDTVRKSFQASDAGFTFQLDKDWRGIVPSARLPIV